jgi:hypothetical protein
VPRPGSPGAHRSAGRLCPQPPGGGGTSPAEGANGSERGRGAYGGSHPGPARHTATGGACCGCGPPGSLRRRAHPAADRHAGPAAASKPLPPLEPPKGLVFQGVLQGPGGREALVDYAPGSEAAGTRSGSLRVGDVGTGQGDSLLPPGWRVQAIDVDRGVLVLQAGKQSVSLVL